MQELNDKAEKNKRYVGRELTDHSSSLALNYGAITSRCHDTCIVSWVVIIFTESMVYRFQRCLNVDEILRDTI